MRPPPPTPSKMWKVIARIEQPHRDNGEVQHQWITVREKMPRGTAEAIAQQVAEHGFRLDSPNIASGSTYYPPHRVWMVEVVLDDMEVS